MVIESKVSMEFNNLVVLDKLLGSLLNEPLNVVIEDQEELTQPVVEEARVEQYGTCVTITSIEGTSCLYLEELSDGNVELLTLELLRLKRNRRKKKRRKVVLQESVRNKR